MSWVECKLDVMSEKWKFEGVKCSEGGKQR